MRGRKNNLGKSLLKNRRKKVKAHRGLAQKPKGSSSGGDYTHVAHSAAPEKQGLISVIEQTDLDDFLEAAELSKREFEAVRGEMTIVDADGGDLEDLVRSRADLIDARRLPVPRRPEWTRGETSADSLHEMEDEVFLTWRRALARVEDRNSCVLTPFERNPQVWRQLWRVLERSDLIVQIVDARNPLLYRCEDLEAYCAEIGKPSMLLVNKADFLTVQQREAWARWFGANGVNAAFFSAHAAQEVLDECEGAGLGRMPTFPPPPSPEEDDSALMPSKERPREVSPEVLDREGLVRVLQRFAVKMELLREAAEEDEGPSQFDDIRSTFAGMDGIACTIGTVGYPNVGKSSVINVLMGVTTADLGRGVRVAVGATPGRTKHFQTHRLRNADDCDQIMVCDCPGLVFPSAVHAKAELVLSGILSVDQMRDFRGAFARCASLTLRCPHARRVRTRTRRPGCSLTPTYSFFATADSNMRVLAAPIKLMTQQLPRTLLEEKYGIKLKPSLTAQKGGADRCTPAHFMDTLANARGFKQGKRSGPDQSRASRLAIKDYLRGNIVYAHPAPACDGVDPVEGAALVLAEDENERVLVGDAAKKGRAELNEDAALEQQFEAALFIEMQDEIAAEKAAAAEAEMERAVAAGATVSKKKFHKKQARSKNRVKARALERDIEEYEKHTTVGFLSKNKNKSGRKAGAR
jgi:large subunit GTPase 1